MPIPAASQVVSTEVMNANAITMIIGNINGLYTNVFTFIAIFVTIVGIVIPIAVTRYQGKKLAINQKKISDELSAKSEETKEQLIAELEIKLADKLSKFEQTIVEIENQLKEKIYKTETLSNAKAHHLQARSGLDAEHYASASKDMAISAAFFASAEDESNMQTALKNLVELGLPKVKKNDFEKDEELDVEIQLTVEAITKLNEKGRYDRTLKELSTAIKEAKARV